MKAIRFTFAIFLLAGLAAAHERYEAIDTTDFGAHPETYDGRMVEVRGNVIAIGADSKSLQIFDGASRMMIGVKLTQLSKAQRSALMRNPVRRVLVYGQATISGGRLVIDAHKIEALSTEANTADQSPREIGPGGR